MWVLIELSALFFLSNFLVLHGTSCSLLFCIFWWWWFICQLQAENCDDAEVIYEFLEANQIGQNHSVYYLAYALHMETKNKFRKTDDIFNLGIARWAPLKLTPSATCVIHKLSVFTSMLRTIVEFGMDEWTER